MHEKKSGVSDESILMLAHELKAPLNAVARYLESMQNRVHGTEIGSYDNEISRSQIRINEARTLISDFLALAVADSFSRPAPENVRIKEIFNNIINENNASAAEKNIVLKCNIPDDLEFFCSVTDIDSIASNLITNAVKYNRENGSVSINAKTSRRTLEITVSDTGIGLSEEDMKRLGGEFVRIKNQLTKNIPGTGLGLSIVKRIAERCGGGMKITSEPGKGSVFTVTLKTPKNR